MITVRRSDTGAYVLVHEPSQLAMVGEDLEATFARMQEHLRDNPSLVTAAASHGPRPGPAASPASSRRAWMVGLGVLALLPFLWLGVLHYTLGGLIDELRTPGGQAQERPTKDIEKLTTEVGELRQTVDRLQAEVSDTRQGVPRAGRKIGAARPPADQSAPADGALPDVDDDPEDEDAEDDAPAPERAKPEAAEPKPTEAAPARKPDPDEP